MFRKALLSLAVLAVLVAAFAPASAEAAAPQTSSKPLIGQIVYLKLSGEIAVASSPLSRYPTRIQVDKETVIRLGHLAIDFSQLRVGDLVTVTLRPAISGDTTVYRAQLIEVTRLPGSSTANR